MHVPHFPCGSPLGRPPIKESRFIHTLPKAEGCHAQGGHLRRPAHVRRSPSMFCTWGAKGGHLRCSCHVRRSAGRVTNPEQPRANPNRNRQVFPHTRSRSVRDRNRVLEPARSPLFTLDMRTASSIWSGPTHCRRYCCFCCSRAHFRVLAL